MTSDNHNKELEPDMASVSGPHSFLQLQLCPPPVSPLGVVPDRVAGPHPGVEMGKDRWCDMMNDIT